MPDGSVASHITSHIRPGDLVVSGQVLGEPTALLEDLFAGLAPDCDIRLFGGMGLTPVLEKAPDCVHLMSFVGMGSNTKLIAQGRMSLVPCHMSELPWALTDGPLRPDVVLIRVSPPDADGTCSLGVESDYIYPAVQAARTVIAEINENVPVVAGDTGVEFDRIDAFIRSDRPLPEYPRTDPSGLERAIAANVAPFVRDGSCLQIGVGRLGEAILQAVSDRRDLSVHSGMVGETILEMARDGIVTGARKGVDPGQISTGSVLGGADAVRLAASEPTLRLRSVSHTHNAQVVAQIDDFLCVNSAIEVDLLGEVNTETTNGRYVGGIGGAVDFLRAATTSRGGRSVVAIPAGAKGGVSRIVPKVDRVTVGRSDVDAVVTEHGVAELRGVSEGERARRLIAIAAPECRDELLAEAARVGL